MAQSNTIVLVHGLWLNHECWDEWKARFSERGYHVISPEWPGMDGDIESLRRDPSPMDGVGVAEITDQYEKVIRNLDSAPIIMGHSFGGLITQQLLDRGMGVAGVALHPAPPKGVFKLPLSSLRAGFPVLKSPANRRRTVSLTRSQFHFAFANTVGESESNELWDKYQVPTTGRPLWQAATANLSSSSTATKVNFHNSTRAPLLLIAGSQDNTVPPSVVQENCKRYRHSTAVTEYREFNGRPHFTMAVPGWEVVADFALNWVETHAR